MYKELARLARRLEATGIDSDPNAYARINAIAARLYGVSRPQFEHVLTTFPLLPAALRQGCLQAFDQGTQRDRVDRIGG